MFALLNIKGNIYEVNRTNNYVNMEITKEEAKRIAKLLTNCLEEEEKKNAQTK